MAIGVSKRRVTGKHRRENRQRGSATADVGISGGNARLCQCAVVAWRISGIINQTALAQQQRRRWRIKWLARWRIIA